MRLPDTVGVLFTPILILWIGLLGCEQSAGQSERMDFSWSADFEQGNAAEVHLRDDGAIGFSIKKAPAGKEYLWFYFEVYGSSEDALEFVLENAARAHQTGGRWNITRPFVSSDGFNWQRAVDIHYGKEPGIGHLFGDPVFRFRSPVIAETLKVAYFRPYTSRDLKKFIVQFSGDSRVQFSFLNISEERRAIEEIKIINPIKSDTLPEILVVAREHPGETPASFVCEGFIDGLLNNTAGERLLNSYQFNIIPILNVDGVAHGYYYHNANSINLARDWEEYHAAETRVFASMVNAISKRSSLKLVINLHSSNDPGKGHFFLAMPEKALSRENTAFQKALLSAADNKHPQMQGSSPVTLLGLPGITGNALYRNYGVYCLYFESNYSRGADGSEVTIKSLHEVGVALVQVLAEVLVPE